MMRILRRVKRAARNRKRGFANDSGLAAIEFALLLPFLALLYLGSAELILGIMLQRQTTLAATTVANIVAQYTSISASTQMPDILNAATQIFEPNPASNANVVVSLITISSTGQATVTWSQALSGSGRTVGQVITVPATLDTPNTYLLLSESSYAYTPAVDFMNLGTQTLTASIFMLPRASTTINLTT
jgi:Flp pilus assembly protein TadG